MLKSILDKLDDFIEKSILLFSRIKYLKSKKGYKASHNYKCINNFVFEVGKTYEIEENPYLCTRGFHYCQNPVDVISYKDVNPLFNLFEIEALGSIHCSNNKCCTNKIKILREITDPDEMFNLIGVKLIKDGNLTYIITENSCVQYIKLDKNDINDIIFKMNDSDFFQMKSFFSNQEDNYDFYKKNQDGSFFIYKVYKNTFQIADSRYVSTY